MSAVRIGLLAGLLVAGLATVILRLHEAEWGVPFAYSGGDPLLSFLWVRSVLDHGTYLDNPDLAAPFGLDHRDYPVPDTWHLLAIQALGRLDSRPAWVFNAYYVLSYPLCAATAAAVARSLGAARLASLAVGILFAFLPYHYLRFGGGHYFLSCYWAVPLGVWLALRHQASGWKPWAVAFVVSGAGVYYAVFTVFMIAVGAIRAAVGRRQWRLLLRPAGVSGFLLGLVVLHGLPTLLHQARNGVNPDAIHRSPAEAESLGLKFGQLLLPVGNHRWHALRELRREYDSDPVRPAQNENCCAALGVVGSVGLLWLLAMVFLPSRQPEPADPGLADLATLNLAAVLLANVGGLASLGNLLVSDKIRAYNRISVFVAMLAFLALARAATPGLVWLSGSMRGRVLAAGLGIAVTAVGLADQINQHASPAYTANARAFRADADWVRQIEAQLSRGAMVFQLPYLAYPEHPTPPGVSPYEHLRAYLAGSGRLRFSYGAMKGRAAASWQQRMAHLPIPAMLERLAVCGFAGVIIDRACYPDRGQAIEAEWQTLLGREGIEHPSRRLVFYPLGELGQCLRDASQLTRQDLLSEPYVEFLSGFQASEGGDRWAGLTGQLVLGNPRQRHCRVRLRMTAFTPQAEPSRLRIGDYSETICSTPREIVIECDLLPGRTVWLCECQPPRRFLAQRPGGGAWAVLAVRIEPLE